MAGNDGDGEEWLAHPPRIVLRQQMGEEELALRREVQFKEQDGEAGGAMGEHQRQREQVVMDLTYCEQKVQEAFKRLSILHSREKNKADFFFKKA